MTESGAGTQRGSDECCLRQFLTRGAGGKGATGMNIEAVGALRRQRDTDRDQFAVFWRDDTVGPFGRGVKGEKRARLHRRQGGKPRHQSQIGGLLVGGYGAGLNHDSFQFLPEGGYTRLIGRMLGHENIRVRVDEVFSHGMLGDYDFCFNSMPIDEYFNSELGELP